MVKLGDNLARYHILVDDIYFREHSLHTGV